MFTGNFKKRCKGECAFKAQVIQTHNTPILSANKYVLLICIIRRIFIRMKKVLKKKFTLTLDEDLVEAARRSTDNLSETVCTLLQQFVAECEGQRIKKSLVEYESASEERRQRLGIFGDSARKFL